MGESTQILTKVGIQILEIQLFQSVSDCYSGSINVQLKGNFPTNKQKSLRVFQDIYRSWNSKILTEDMKELELQE